MIAGFRELIQMGVDEEGGHLYLQGEDATNPTPQIPSLFRSNLNGSNLVLLMPGMGGAFHVDTAELADTEAPAVTIFSPSGGPTNNEQVTLSASVTDASALTGAVWLHDGTEQGPVTVFGGDVTVTGIVLHPGENVLTVRATDIAGNTGEASVSVTWTPDRTATVEGPPSVTEGQRAGFHVVVDSTGEIGGLTLTLLYDPAEFRDPIVEPGAVPEGGSATVNTTTPGEVTLTFAAGGGTLPTGPQGVLGVSLRARSVPASAATAAVGLRVADVSDGSGTPLPVGTFASGAVLEILARLYTGDVNTNAGLDTGDATLMQRMLAGIDPPRPWDHLLNDLNGSATLDSGDVVRVLRAVTGIDLQPAPQRFAARKLARAPAPPVGPTALLESPKPHGVAGEEIRVRVNLTDLAANISGASFALDYPAAALRLDAAADHRPGPLVTGSSFVLWNLSPAVSNYATQSGTISLGASASAPWPGSADGGTVAEFDFTVQPGAVSQPAWPLVLRNARLSSADGFDVTSVPGSATLTFVATPVSYAAWREARFSEADRDNPLVAGWDADPDGNGFANGAEYKAGSTPVLEAFRVPGPGGAHCLEVRFVQDLRAVEGTLTAEVSTDGVIWEAAPGGIPATEMTELSVDYAAGTRVVAFRSLATLEVAPRLFLRIVFTAP